MDSAMLVEISFLSELLSAYCALVGLLSVMHAHMIDKVPTLIELFVSIFVLTKEVPHSSSRLFVVLVLSYIFVAVQRLHASVLYVVVLWRSVGPLFVFPKFRIIVVR
jgi:hypothetical protein